MDGDRIAIVDYDLLKRLKGKSRQLNNIYHSKELATGLLAASAPAESFDAIIRASRPR